MGEKQNQSFQLSFNSSLKVDFQGSQVISALRCIRAAFLLALCLASVAAAAAEKRASGTRPSQVAASAPGVYNPVADPRATVTVGRARFTVLTPELIRMEWAADGKF